MNFGIFFALFSSIFFAFSYIALKKSYKEFSPSVAFLLDALFGLILWVPISIFLGVNLNNFWSVLPWAIISAILSEAYFFYVLSKGEVSITGTILASYPIYTVIISRFVNQELLSFLQIIAIAVTILGTLIVSIEKNIKANDFHNKQNYIFWALSGAIAVGLSDSLSKNVINAISLQDFLFVLAFVQLPIALIYLRIEGENLKHLGKLFKNIGLYKFATVGSLLNVLGVLFLWLAFGQTFASIASPLTATYPAMMVILAKIFLKEKIPKKNYFGITLIIIGIIFLSLIS